MAISNFAIEVQSDNALRRELYIAAGASIDYEVAADRVQRGWLVAQRAATNSVTAKEIIRGFKLDITNVEEPAMWNSAALAPVTLRVPADLSAVSEVVDLSALAHDPEGDSFAFNVGTVPSGITATRGVGQQAHLLTVGYPAQTANPSSNLSFMVPLFLEQPLGSKITGSDRNLPVRVLRFAPEGIHTSYFSPAAPGRLYIDAGQTEFNVTLNNWIVNHSNRPLLLDNGTDGTTSWNTATADYTLGVANGVWSFRGVRASGFTGPTQTTPVQIRVRTNDVGDESVAYLNFLVRVEAASG